MAIIGSNEKILFSSAALIFLLSTTRPDKPCSYVVVVVVVLQLSPFSLPLPDLINLCLSVVLVRVLILVLVVLVALVSHLSSSFLASSRQNICNNWFKRNKHFPFIFAIEHKYIICFLNLLRLPCCETPLRELDGTEKPKVLQQIAPPPVAPILSQAQLPPPILSILVSAGLLQWHSAARPDTMAKVPSEDFPRFGLISRGRHLPYRLLNREI